ncbi:MULTISPECIES: cell division protein ZapA [unclassified Moraxella]|uniref:cell division protein ZapA n=1 Tax=unclassified Moraxella TaxID=2685852 RepID=UPI002B403A54|nr:MULTISPECIES: cell division protein ZapA [unclassified Moraxella]
MTNHNDLNIKDATEFKPVHISIAGTPHRIICPIDRIKSLETNADKLNEKIREIRQATKGKMLNNEELLVLACLDLYDQVQFLTNDIQLRTQTTTQAAALLEKINKDAKSILR